MNQIDKKIKKIASLIDSAGSLVLTTHKMGDGDGIGSMMAFYHALTQINKKVRAISVDEIAPKYHFLTPKKWAESFATGKNPLKPTDIAFILDTNDYRRTYPLYNELTKKCQKIIYIDHHPVLKTGPRPFPYSIVDTSRASTGEIIYLLIKEMGIKMNKAIAQALYVSIVFDTQKFQFIRGSNMSHKISAELIPYIDNEDIYSKLFGLNSTQKLDMMAQAIRQTKYHHQKKVAVLNIHQSDLSKKNLNIEDACDVLDMNLKILSTRLSILIVHLPNKEYKLSFRSKKGDVSKLAELFGGGGHKHASGATLTHYTKDPKKEILKAIKANPSFMA